MLAEIALPIVIIATVFGPPCVSKIIEARDEIGKILLRKRIKKLIIKNTYRNMKSTDDICVICQDDLKNSGKCYEMYCSHIYHKKCLMDWLEQKPTCPCCGNCITLSDGRKISA